MLFRSTLKEKQYNSINKIVHHNSCFLRRYITFAYSFKQIINMKTVTVTMNERELRRFESFKEAEKIVRGIKRGLNEVKQSKDGKIQLKSARQLANEI